MWLATIGLAAAQPNELADRARRIGVLVLSGQQVEVHSIGAMVFWNARGTLVTPEDAVPARLYEVIERELAAEERFEVRRLRPPSGAEGEWVAAAYADNEGTWFGAPKLDALGPLVREIIQGCECDAVVVLAERRGETPLIPYGVRGVTFLNGRDISLHASLLLIDPRRMQVVASGGGGWDPKAFGPMLNFRKGDRVPLDEPQWRHFERALVSNARPNLRSSLYRIGLRPSCTQAVYEWYTPQPQRNPSHPDHRQAPPTPAGADPARCPLGAR